MTDFKTWAHSSLVDFANHAMSKIDALTKQLAERDAEIERLRVDAERYRWLRDPNNQQNEDDMCVSDGYFVTYYEEELDDAIDAARAEVKS